MRQTYAFTLIETMLVIVVVAALVLLGQQQYESFSNDRRVAAIQPVVVQARTAIQNYFNDHCSCLVYNYIQQNLGVAPSPAPGNCQDFRVNGNTLTATVPASTFSSVSAKLPYANPDGMMPFSGQVNMTTYSDQTPVTIHLTFTLLMPLAYKSHANDYQTTLNANSVQVANGKVMLTWDWLTTAQSAPSGSPSLDTNTANMSYFSMQNVPSYQSIVAGYKQAGGLGGGVPPQMPAMGCAYIPAWIYAATQCQLNGNC